MVGDKSPSIEISGIADSRPQANLWELNDFRAAGFLENCLRPVSMSICAANKNSIRIAGVFSGKFVGQAPNGDIISCIADIYVSDSVSGFYLSYDTMVDLLILDSTFPTIGSCNPTNRTNESSPGHIPSKVDKLSCHAVQLGSTDTQEDSTQCNCPQRCAVPSKPSCLPFPPTPDNNDKMRQWLLDRYAASTFNTCPHRPLPCMSGPPVEIHLEETGTPRVCHTPAPIPMHWQKRVYDDLLRDEALGVIERVPYGEAVTWCHRMVVTRKQDGSPRRTVDLSPLNKFCRREAFPSESPFKLARRVPGNTWKTVTDAWNGYHSVPLRDSDKHLTTFITPFGRWRYTRAPQGFLSSGDGYNRRFDAVLSEFQRKERCVDDTIHFDEDLEEHWWRTIELLTILGSAGIVLNPEKFQFCQKEVDFAGFHISENTIEPLPKYLEAIQSFPTPTSISDIRSWFGLVNQVSNYAQLRDIMAPFRPFLSPKVTFFWTPDLERAFQLSKTAITAAIRHGVEIFDVS